MASGNEIRKDKHPDCSIPLQGGGFLSRQNEVLNSVGSNMTNVAPDILLGSLLMTNTSSNSPIDLNFSDDWGDTPFASNPFSGFQSFEGNPGNVSQPVFVDFDNVLNRGTDFSGFQSVTDGRRELSHTTQQSGHINGSGVVWPQSSTNIMHGDSVSVPVRFHNLLNSVPDDARRVLASSNPSISSVRVDDTLLALGTQFSKRDLSTQFRDFNNNDRRNSFPDLNTPIIENVPQSFHRHTQRKVGISSPQNNAGGFSNRAPNLVDMALYNNSGALYGTNTALGVQPSHNPELPRLGSHHFLPTPRDSSFSLGRNNHTSPTDFTFNRGAQDHFSLTSRAYDGFQDEEHYGRQAKMPRLTPQSSKTAIPSIQPSSNQLQRQAVKFSGNSMIDPIIISPTDRAERSSIQLDQSGALTRSKEGGIILQPQDLLQQPTNIGNAVPMKKRTGLSKALNVPTQHHSTGQVSSVLKPSAEVQASSVLPGVSNSINSLKHPPFVPVHLPVAPHVLGSTISNAVTAVQQTPASLVQPSLKKRTAPLVTSMPQAQRRNMTRQSVKELSVPLPPGRRPTQLGSQITQTVQPAYIKKPDSNGPAGVPLSGVKCPLCKRDLSYMPEGNMYQPSVPPAVAVLPCRHVFHDHCLQLITTPDQSKDPPCIPCAIGE